jgi:Sulfotransferase family
METPTVTGPLTKRRGGTSAAARRDSVVHSDLKKVAKDVLRSTVGRATSAWLPPPGKLVIFSRGRTGSNLLGSLLKSHPDVRHHGEIFGEYYIQNTLIKRQINKIGPVNYFDNISRRMLTEKVVGVKFLYYQLEPAYAGRWGVENLPEMLPALQARTDIKFVHLKRRNKLATLISRKLAARSGKYVGGSYGDGRLILTSQECLAEFQAIERWEDLYDSEFASHDVIEMYYEDLVKSVEREMGRVCAPFDLEAAHLGSRMHKQNTRSPIDLIENWDELERSFAATPYAWFFAEYGSGR